MIKEDGDPTTPHKIATGTEPTVSHLYILFFPCVVWRATAHVETKALNIRHQAQKRVSMYLRWNSPVSKMISCVRTQYKEDNTFI